ncbi:MAG: FecR domain-containing protein [Myxococcales bacterium]|nr:FecR domain-containing protein [Myxococcales bacterium]
MAEHETKLAEALLWVREDWSEERVRRGRVALERASARRRRAQRATVAGVTGLALAASFVAAFWPRAPQEEAWAAFSPIGITAPDPATGSDTPGALRFQDGSVAIPLGTDTAMATSLDEPERAGLELMGGSARFDVVPRPSRSFEVRVGSVVVSVLGTRFDVRRQPRHVLVHVQRGRVRVQWLGGERILTASQSGLFPLELDGAGTVEGPPGASDVASVSAPNGTDGGGVSALDTAPDAFDLDFTLEELELEAAEANAAGAGASDAARDGARGEHGAQGGAHDWRSMARAGRYDDAYEAARGVTVGSSMGDLMLAADTARLTGHLAEAVTHLERALQLHPGDRRAHLAAFTLGRVQLQQGQPQRAARAFARAQQLDRAGVMTEAALAREVQALARAGQRDAASRRARVYLQRFPSGRHAGSVRAYAHAP